jgi:hypothetical protein
MVALLCRRRSSRGGVSSLTLGEFESWRDQGSLGLAANHSGKFATFLRPETETIPRNHAQNFIKISSTFERNQTPDLTDTPKNIYS